MELTGVTEVVVSEVVASKRLVLLHTGLDTFQHLDVLVELVVGEVHFLEFLGDRDALQHDLDSLIPEAVARQNQFLHLRLRENKDFKQGPGSCVIDVAVAEGQRLQILVGLDTVSQRDQAL